MRATLRRRSEGIHTRSVSDIHWNKGKMMQRLRSCVSDDNSVALEKEFKQMPVPDRAIVNEKIGMVSCTCGWTLLCLALNSRLLQLSMYFSRIAGEHPLA